jgi:hypothetical protein
MTTTTRPTTRRRALAGASAVALAGSLAVAAPTSAQAAATAPSTVAPSATACPTGTLPPVVQGAPASFRAGRPAGYWIWHDSRGWHLRVTHPTRTRLVFTGVVTATSPMTTVRVRDEAHDRIVRSADRRTTTFRFTNYGGVDGLDLAAGCATTVTFRLYAAGHLVSPSRIHLGAKAAPATANPVRITRIPAA